MLRLTSVNQFSGLWAAGVVPGCLAPGPGMYKVEGYCYLLGCVGQVEEVWLWVGLHIKGGLQAGPLL